MQRSFTFFFSVVLSLTLYAQPNWTQFYVDDWEDNSWDEMFYYANSLDAQGRIDTAFHYESPSNGWDLNDIVLYDYDALGRLDRRTVEYQQAGVDWAHEFRYYYDLNGRMDRMVLYMKSHPGDPWEELMRYDYLYNGQDQLYRETVTGFVDGQPGTVTRYTYSYDAYGKTDEVLFEIREGQPLFEPYQRWTYVYGAGALPQQRLIEQWNTAAGSWSDKFLWHYVYNPDGSKSVEIEQVWDSQQAGWVNQFRYRYYYFDDLSVAELSESVDIYPNPVTDQLTVLLQDEGKLEISVSDLSGKELIRQSGTAMQQVSFGGLSAGAYVVTVLTEKGRGVRKIVKS